MRNWTGAKFFPVGLSRRPLPDINLAEAMNRLYFGDSLPWLRDVREFPAQLSISSIWIHRLIPTPTTSTLPRDKQVSDSARKSLLHLFNAPSRQAYQGALN